MTIINPNKALDIKHRYPHKTPGSRNRWRCWTSLCLTGILYGLASTSAHAVALTRGPYLQIGTPTSIVVRWRTDSPTNSVVSYGVSAGNLPNTATDGASVTEHSVTLNNLQPATRYYYAVGSGGGMLAGAGDASYSFQTAPNPGTATPVRIWAVGDSGGGTSTSTDEVRDQYMAYAGEKNTNLWLMLGDNAYNDGTDSEYQSAVFDMFPVMLRQAALWPTLGNHDVLNENDNPQPTGNIPYYSIFTLPTGAEAGGVASGTEEYYSFDYANIHFICLNSFNVDRSVNGPMLTWLQNDIAATNRQWIIAFWHHPPYSKGTHDSDLERWSIDMRQNALRILESYGVDLVLTGHSHSYERSYLLNGHYGDSTTFDPGTMKLDGGDGREDGTGAYTKPNVTGIPNEGAVYVVAGNASYTTDPLWLTRGYHPAMYISLKDDSKKFDRGSLIVDVNGGQLDVKLLDATGVIRDYFTLTKGQDTTPPVLLNAAPGGASLITVVFSEPLEAASAGSAANYSISNGIAVTGATLGSDGRSVTLNVSPLTPYITYILTVNNVQDQAGNPIAAGSQAQFSYDPVVSLELQDGVAPTSGYAGTRDTYIREDRATTNFGSATTLDVRGNSGFNSCSLLMWDLSSIPPGATIQSASLTIDVTNTSVNDYSIFELLRDWQESSATWNDAASGNPWETPGAKGATDRGAAVLGSVVGNSLGSMTFPLNAAGVAVIQDWVDGVRPNRGFILANPTAGDGLGISSSEVATATGRPRLSIVYSDATPGSGNLPPTASYNYACNNLDCTFTDTSSDSDGSIAGRQWNFGDGTTSTASNPSHSYASAGSYTVSLTVTDNAGASASTSKSVTVAAANVAPTAAYSYGCTYLDCTFTDSSIDSDGSIAGRLWSFGDGTTSTAANPQHSFAAGGTYTVSLTVTDNVGANASTSKTLTVAANPNAPPAAPTDLTATVQTVGRGSSRSLIVTLAWTDNSNNEGGFVLERCTQTGKGKSSTCTYSTLVTLGPNTTSYMDTTTSGSYKYRVRAYSGNGSSAYSNEVSI